MVLAQWQNSWQSSCNLANRMPSEQATSCFYCIFKCKLQMDSLKLVVIVKSNLAWPMCVLLHTISRSWSDPSRRGLTRCAVYTPLPFVSIQPRALNLAAVWYHTLGFTQHLPHPQQKCWQAEGLEDNFLLNGIKLQSGKQKSPGTEGTTPRQGKLQPRNCKIGENAED